MILMKCAKLENFDSSCYIRMDRIFANTGYPACVSVEELLVDSQF